jgi:hypothetical protein
MAFLYRTHRMLEAQTILDRLRKLAARDNRPLTLPTDTGGASALFTFVTRERERIAGCAFARHSIVVIVEGAKELVTMGRQLRFSAGTVLVLPPGWRGDVVNDPDAASGVYRAIFIDFPHELVDRVRRNFAPKPEQNSVTGDIAVALDPVLAAAIHHAGEGIAAGTLPAMLIEHRLCEVLMVLGMRGALPARTETLSDAVRGLIRWQLDRRHDRRRTRHQQRNFAPPAAGRSRLAARPHRGSARRARRDAAVGRRPVAA